MSRLKTSFFRHDFWFGIGIAYSKPRWLGRKNVTYYGPSLQFALGLWVLQFTWSKNDSN
jgi:hypothetical protein